MHQNNMMVHTSFWHVKTQNNRNDYWNKWRMMREQWYDMLISNNQITSDLLIDSTWFFFACNNNLLAKLNLKGHRHNNEGWNRQWKFSTFKKPKARNLLYTWTNHVNERKLMKLTSRQKGRKKLFIEYFTSCLFPMKWEVN